MNSKYYNSILSLSVPDVRVAVEQTSPITLHSPYNEVECRNPPKFECKIIKINSSLGDTRLKVCREKQVSHDDDVGKVRLHVPPPSQNSFCSCRSKPLVRHG